MLLKNPDKLDPDRDEGERLQKALALNAPLAAAYYLKGDPEGAATPGRWHSVGGGRGWAIVEAEDPKAILDSLLLR